MNILNLCRSPRLAGLVLAALTVGSSGCAGYRVVRPEEIEVPSYDPRPVAIPAYCEDLVARAVEQGMRQMDEAEGRMVLFCQQQQIVRAQEEEAAAKRLEAHAETAQFALQVTVTAIGALFAALTWVF